MLKYLGQGRSAWLIAATVIAAGALLSARGLETARAQFDGEDDYSSDIAPLAGNGVDTPIITPRIKTGIGNNPALSGTKINVSIEGNTVTLEGTTKTRAQRQLAARIAHFEAPSYRIINHLRVQNPDYADDNAFSPAEMQLLPRIQRALVRNRTLRGSRITVLMKSNQNQIILSGTARNATQIQIASRIARDNAPGYAIINHLRVAPLQSTLGRTRHRKARAQTRKSGR